MSEIGTLLPCPIRPNWACGAAACIRWHCFNLSGCCGGRGLHTVPPSQPAPIGDRPTAAVGWGGVRPAAGGGGGGSRARSLAGEARRSQTGLSDSVWLVTPAHKLAAGAAGSTRGGGSRARSGELLSLLSPCPLPTPPSGSCSIAQPRGPVTSSPLVLSPLALFSLTAFPTSPPRSPQPDWSVWLVIPALKVAAAGSRCAPDLAGPNEARARQVATVRPKGFTGQESGLRLWIRAEDRGAAVAAQPPARKQRPWNRFNRVDSRAAAGEGRGSNSCCCCCCCDGGGGGGGGVLSPFRALPAPSLQLRGGRGPRPLLSDACPRSHRRAAGTFTGRHIRPPMHSPPPGCRRGWWLRGRRRRQRWPHRPRPAGQGGEQGGEGRDRLAWRRRYRRLRRPGGRQCGFLPAAPLIRAISAAGRKGGCEGTRERGNEGARERGSEGAREKGSERGRETRRGGGGEKRGTSMRCRRCTPLSPPRGTNRAPARTSRPAAPPICCAKTPQPVVQQLST